MYWRCRKRCTFHFSQGESPWEEDDDDDDDDDDDHNYGTIHNGCGGFTFPCSSTAETMAMERQNNLLTPVR